MIMFKEADRFSKKKGVIYLKRGWFNQKEMIPFYVLFWGLCSFLSIEYIYVTYILSFLVAIIWIFSPRNYKYDYV